MNEADIDTVAKIICKENGDNPRLKTYAGTGHQQSLVPVWHHYREAAKETIEAGCKIYMDGLKTRKWKD